MGCFYFSEHQHKGKAYINALVLGGHWRTNSRITADFIFIDHDIGPRGVGYRKGIEMAREHGKPVFIYPHSARPNVMADTHSPWPHTRALFTIATGHAEVLKALDYPCPVEVSGWTYSEIKPFKPSRPHGKINVLFAPIHPNNNGFLGVEDQTTNRNVFELLLGMNEINLTIRYIHELEQNGIWYDPRAMYVCGKPDGTTKEIEEADVVIGSYTLAAITVAIGKPLIMMAEQMIPHVGNTSGLIFYSKNWEKYREIMRYPFEIENAKTGTQALNMMADVMKKNSAVEEWKRKFIGLPFDGNKFVEKVNSYLQKG